MAEVSEQNTKTEPIRSRPPARVAMAGVAVVVAIFGVWGAVTTIQAMRGYQTTQRLQRTIDHARYSLALERSAIRDTDTTRARKGLAAAAASFAADLRSFREAGTAGDVTRAVFLGQRHTGVFDAGRRVVSAQTASTSASESERREFEDRSSELDAALSAAQTDIRGRSSDAWPAEPIQKVELAATLLLIVTGLSGCAILLMRLAGHRRRVERARRQEVARLEQAALTDSLTGLGNHRAFYEELERELARRARTGSYFSVVMLDLDRLKEVNDTLGHLAGDERICAVAECLTATLRTGGAYRTGGDEFMVLLPGERAWGALTFAQRLQTELMRSRTVLHVSCGIAETSALESADALVHNADLALYEAKRSGRRIVVYSAGLRPKPTAQPDLLAAQRHQQLLATALAQAVDAKDAGTRNHCETVSALCIMIGQSLGLSDVHVTQLGLAGLLHDVGKIGIADALLQKKEELDPDERSEMRGHVEIGRSIVAAAGLVEEAEWVLHHHEHVDGSGYPDGLRGSAIPLESRVIHVADAFEAMTANRPYNPARLPVEAFAELDRGVGTQFDGDCVDALRSALGPDMGSASRWFAPADEAPATVPTTIAQVASA